MAFKNILSESRDGVGFITVNRPDKLNALNDETINELIGAFHSMSLDETVRAVVLTGSGPKAFVAGADISELARNDAVTGKKTSQKGQLLNDFIASMGKPVVAAVNGFALGGGCELAMACTIRVASENAKFGQPEVNLGLIPGYGGTQRLPRLVGKGRAIELLLTGDMIEAKEAERIGLVNKVVAPDKLAEEAEKLARKLAAKAPLAVKYITEAVNSGMEMPMKDAMAFEAGLFGNISSSADAKEGMKAFMEKRSPKFEGK